MFITIIGSGGKPLLNISTTGMEIPGIAIANNLFSTPSPLKDSFVPYQQVGKLVNHLVSGNLFQRLNHLGFCYQVKSIADEKEKLIEKIRRIRWSNWYCWKKQMTSGKITGFPISKST